MLNIFGITFHAYGLTIGVAIWCAITVVSRVARQRQLTEINLDDFYWYPIIGGIIGARVYHVIDKWSYYSENLVKIFFVWEGGLALWGAVIGGLIALFFKWRIDNDPPAGGWKISEMLDLVGIGLPLGQAIGRWGNFFNNEIVGKNGEQLFLIESMANILLFSFIYIFRNRIRGKLFGIYLVGYGIIRLISESMRASADQWHIGSINVAATLAVISVAGGIYFIWRKRI